MVSVSLRIGTPNVDMRPVGHGLPILPYRRTLRYGRTGRSGELSGISRLGVSMQYIKLGTTGLDVSPVAIGAMTYGDPGRGHPVWSLGEDESRPLLKAAIDAGINFFDTANMYSQGSSEEILGRALKDFARRDEVVIATKVRHAMRPGPNGAGLSRKAIFQEVDNSLKRLGTDYIDLYQIHRNDKRT